MTKRRRFTEAEVIETVLRQGGHIPCFRCKAPLRLNHEIEREHILELALGGGDAPINCGYSHKQCHRVFTDGTPATTAGSSKQRIGKVKRILKGKMRVEKGAKKRATRWPEGRKMMSKGFVKI